MILIQQFAFAGTPAAPSKLVLSTAFPFGPHGPRRTKNPPATLLPYWQGSFTDTQGKAVQYKMVGVDPSTGTGSTIPVYLIPIRMSYKDGNGHVWKFDPTTHLVKSGETVIQNVESSPIFQPYPFNIGEIDLGSTQFGNAYQRANFWSQTKSNQNYLLLGQPQELTAQDVVPKNAYLTKDKKALVTDLDNFDDQLESIVGSFGQISSAGVVVFVSYNVFLEKDGQFAGGYHTLTGGQTYIYAGYYSNKVAGDGGDDVAPLSHEIAEWINDPFTDNTVPNCDDPNLSPVHSLEVADPLHQYEHYYDTGNFEYHLQSPVFLTYFGADRATSANGWLSFRNQEDYPCPKMRSVRDLSGYVTVNALNNEGHAVGFYQQNIGDRQHGFLATDQGRVTLIDLDFLGALNVYPSAINDDGLIAGYYDAGGGYLNGFTQDEAGNVVDFSASGQQTWPIAVNRHQVVAGYYYGWDKRFHGFTRDLDGKISPYDYPGAGDTFITSENDDGDFVGFFHNRKKWGVFLQVYGQAPIELFPPGFDSPLASPHLNFINGRGIVAGSYCADLKEGCKDRAFIRYKNGSIKGLTVDNDPGLDLLALNKDAASIIEYQGTSFFRQPEAETALLPITVKGAQFTIGQAMNDNGEVAGIYSKNGVYSLFFLKR